MADELEELLNEGGAKDSGDSEVGKDEERSEESKKRVRRAIAERDAAFKERDDLRKKNQELEFLSNFKDQASKYPFAKDHEAEIREQAAKGISVEDATILILSKNKKLVSPEEIRAQKAREGSLGGSADTTHVEGGQKTSKEMTQAERVQALKDAESKGEIFIG